MRGRELEVGCYESSVAAHSLTAMLKTADHTCQLLLQSPKAISTFSSKRGLGGRLIYLHQYRGTFLDAMVKHGEQLSP